MHLVCRLEKQLYTDGVRGIADAGHYAQRVADEAVMRVA